MTNRLGFALLWASVSVLFVNHIATRIAFGQAAESAKGKEPKKENRTRGPNKDARHLHFVFGQHTTVFIDGGDRKVVNVGDVLRVMEEASQESEIYPHFMSTAAGYERQKRFQNGFFFPLYRKMYKEEKIKGSSWGSLSPRAYERWDRIRSQADLEPGPDAKHGFVFAPDGKPQPDAEIFLLPKEHINGVYLRDGRNRNILEEHVVISDLHGQFAIVPEDGEYWVVAAHPNGFRIVPLKELSDWNIYLLPWARVSGTLKPPKNADALELSKYPLSITSHPVPGLSFSIYETEVDEDGKFEQLFVPPGAVQVSRAFKLEGGGSMSFPEQSFELEPDAGAEAAFGDVNAQMRQMIEQANERHRQLAR